MMHAVTDYGNQGVPAFLQKLWTLVEDESTNELIAWDATGKSFHVCEQSRFSKEVLPLYFKHNNIASFVRQLNMYGFRKVTNVEHGGLKLEKDDMEFIHPYFQRDEEQLLEHIKRKVATGKADDVKLKTDDVTKVLRDVHSLKGRQENMSSKMDSMERENEALWREVAGLRQKHLKQQKIVNKLIQFLVTLVGNRGLGAGLKRKMPLMINDASQLESQRPAKMARQYAVETDPANLQVIPEVQSPGSVQGYVPTSSVTIEEMVDTTKPQVYALVDPSATTSVTAQQPRIIVVSKSPQQTTLQSQPKETKVPIASLGEPTSSQAALSPPSYSMVNLLETQQRLAELDSANVDNYGEGPTNFRKSEPIFNTGSSPPNVASDSTKTIAIPDSSANTQPGSSLSDLTGQLVSVEDSLDSLKDLLSGNIDPSSLFNLRLDTDTLQGLFTPEAPIPPTPEPFLNMSGDRLEFPESSDHISGNELIQYYPPEDLGSLFDVDIVSPSSPDITDDNMPPMGSSSGLDTPSFTVSSPLALRRQSQMNNITTEEVD